MKQQYKDQVSLLLEILPFVAEVKNFVLKGGTAINLFVQSFPRLSVDIDVTYMPLEDRESTLTGIQAGLFDVRKAVKNKLKDVTMKEKYNKKTKTITRLDVIRGTTLVKIEPNLILRGSIFEPVKMDLHLAVQEVFKTTILDVPVVSVADLYGGKICAALDRQHPRDLFDIKVLFENGGITKEIKQAFLMYLCSHNRPISELLNPNFLNQIETFSDEFEGMANTPVTYNELEKTRERLVETIQAGLTERDKAFLMSFKNKQPDWALVGLKDMGHLPGIRWKQMNLSKMHKDKHIASLNKLEKTLYG